MDKKRFLSEESNKLKKIYPFLTCQQIRGKVLDSWRRITATNYGWKTPKVRDNVRPDVAKISYVKKSSLKLQPFSKPLKFFKSEQNISYRHIKKSSSNFKIYDLSDDDETTSCKPDFMFVRRNKLVVKCFIQPKQRKVSDSSYRKICKADNSWESFVTNHGMYYGSEMKTNKLQKGILQLHDENLDDNNTFPQSNNKVQTKLGICNSWKRNFNIIGESSAHIKSNPEIDKLKKLECLNYNFPVNPFDIKKVECTSTVSKNGKSSKFLNSVKVLRDLKVKEGDDFSYEDFEKIQPPSSKKKNIIKTKLCNSGSKLTPTASYLNVESSELFGVNINDDDLMFKPLCDKPNRLKQTKFSAAQEDAVVPENPSVDFYKKFLKSVTIIDNGEPSVDDTFYEPKIISKGPISEKDLKQFKSLETSQNEMISLGLAPETKTVKDMFEQDYGTLNVTTSSKIVFRREMSKMTYEHSNAKLRKNKIETNSLNISHLELTQVDADFTKVGLTEEIQTNNDVVTKSQQLNVMRSIKLRLKKKYSIKDHPIVTYLKRITKKKLLQYKTTLEKNKKVTMKVKSRKNRKKLIRNNAANFQYLKDKKIHDPESNQQELHKNCLENVKEFHISANLDHDNLNSKQPADLESIPEMTEHASVSEFNFQTHEKIADSCLSDYLDKKIDEISNKKLLIETSAIEEDDNRNEFKVNIISCEESAECEIEEMAYTNSQVSNCKALQSENIMFNEDHSKSDRIFVDEPAQTKTEEDIALSKDQKNTDKDILKPQLFKTPKSVSKKAAKKNKKSNRKKKVCKKTPCHNNSISEPCDSMQIEENEIEIMTTLNKGGLNIENDTKKKEYQDDIGCVNGNDNKKEYHQEEGNGIILRIPLSLNVADDEENHANLEIHTSNNDSSKPDVEKRAMKDNKTVNEEIVELSDLNCDSCPIDGISNITEFQESLLSDVSSYLKPVNDDSRRTSSKESAAVKCLQTSCEDDKTSSNITSSRPKRKTAMPKEPLKRNVPSLKNNYEEKHLEVEDYKISLRSKDVLKRKEWCTKLRSSTLKDNETHVVKDNSIVEAHKPNKLSVHNEHPLLEKPIIKCFNKSTDQKAVCLISLVNLNTTSLSSKANKSESANIRIRKRKQIVDKELNKENFKSEVVDKIVMNSVDKSEHSRLVSNTKKYYFESHTVFSPLVDNSFSSAVDNALNKTAKVTLTPVVENTLTSAVENSITSTVKTTLTPAVENYLTYEIAAEKDFSSPVRNASNPSVVDCVSSFAIENNLTPSVEVTLPPTVENTLTPAVHKAFSPAVENAVNLVLDNALNLAVVSSPSVQNAAILETSKLSLKVNKSKSKKRMHRKKKTLNKRQNKDKSQKKDIDRIAEKSYGELENSQLLPNVEKCSSLNVAVNLIVSNDLDTPVKKEHTFESAKTISTEKKISSERQNKDDFLRKVVNEIATTNSFGELECSQHILTTENSFLSPADINSAVENAFEPGLNKVSNDTVTKSFNSCLKKNKSNSSKRMRGEKKTSDKRCNKNNSRKKNVDQIAEKSPDEHENPPLVSDTETHSSSSHVASNLVLENAINSAVQIAFDVPVTKTSNSSSEKQKSETVKRNCKEKKNLNTKPSKKVVDKITNISFVEHEYSQLSLTTEKCSPSQAVENVSNRIRLNQTETSSRSMQDSEETPSSEIKVMKIQSDKIENFKTPQTKKRKIKNLQILSHVDDLKAKDDLEIDQTQMSKTNLLTEMKSSSILLQQVNEQSRAELQTILRIDNEHFQDQSIPDEPETKKRYSFCQIQVTNYIKNGRKHETVTDKNDTAVFDGNVPSTISANTEHNQVVNTIHQNLQDQLSRKISSSKILNIQVSELPIEEKENNLESNTEQSETLHNSPIVGQALKKVSVNQTLHCEISKVNSCETHSINKTLLPKSVPCEEDIGHCINRNVPKSSSCKSFYDNNNLKSACDENQGISNVDSVSDDSVNNPTKERRVSFAGITVVRIIDCSNRESARYRDRVENTPELQQLKEYTPDAVIKRKGILKSSYSCQLLDKEALTSVFYNKKELLDNHQQPIKSSISIINISTNGSSEIQAKEAELIENFLRLNQVYSSEQLSFSLDFFKDSTPCSKQFKVSNDSFTPTFVSEDDEISHSVHSGSDGNQGMESMYKQWPSSLPQTQEDTGWADDLYSNP